MAEIRWTEEAANCMRQIYEYIAEDNPEAAQRAVKILYEKTGLISRFPDIGYRYQETNREIRILLYGRYRIAYLIKTENLIEILGVFHGAMDIKRYLE